MEAKEFIPTIILTLQVFPDLKFTEKEVAEALQQVPWRDYAEEKRAQSVRYLPEKSGSQGPGTHNDNFGFDHVFEAKYDVTLLDNGSRMHAFRKFAELLTHYGPLRTLPGVVQVSVSLRYESGTTSSRSPNAEQLFGVFNYLKVA